MTLCFSPQSVHSIMGAIQKRWAAPARAPIFSTAVMTVTWRRPGDDASQHQFEGEQVVVTSSGTALFRA